MSRAAPRSRRRRRSPRSRAARWGSRPRRARRRGRASCGRGASSRRRRGRRRCGASTRARPPTTRSAPPTPSSIRWRACSPACGTWLLIASPGPSASTIPSARFVRPKPTRNPATLLTPFGPGREVERRHDRGRVRGVEQPDPDHDREGVLHRASLRFRIGTRGLTEPVAFSSADSADHLLWALAGVPHTVRRGSIALLTLRLGEGSDDMSVLPDGQWPVDKSFAATCGKFSRRVGRRRRGR